MMTGIMVRLKTVMVRKEDQGHDGGEEGTSRGDDGATVALSHVPLMFLLPL